MDVSVMPKIYQYSDIAIPSLYIYITYIEL